MLGSKGILDGMDDGAIIIKTFNSKQLQPNSYDVKLGNWVIRQNRLKFTTDVPAILLSDPYGASKIWKKPQNYPDGRAIVLKPGEFILAHTKEIVGTVHSFSTLLKTRSTIARMGVDVCSPAGFGDVGFVNYWTLEVKNISAYSIALMPNMRVAQISFFRLEGSVLNYSEIGAYRGTFDDWQPEDMLPKLGYDRLF